MGRIAVIDDHADIVLLMRVGLEYDGHEVEATTGPKSWLEQHQPGSVDLIVTDIGMAELDGIELIRRIRMSEPDLPIIALTAFPDTSERAVEAGATAFLLKPFRPVKLSRVVWALLDEEPSAASEAIMDLLEDREWAKVSSEPPPADA